MIQAYGERILVRIVEVEKKSGILILKDEKKEFQIGKIYSLGADLPMLETHEENWMEVDDYVYTRKYAGLLVEYDGVEYVSLEPKEILAFSKELK